MPRFGSQEEKMPKKTSFLGNAAANPVSPEIGRTPLKVTLIDLSSGHEKVEKMNGETIGG
jgi:hypothetical protein